MPAAKLTVQRGRTPGGRSFRGLSTYLVEKYKNL